MIRRSRWGPLPPAVRFAQGVLAAAVNSASDALPSETGGILLGWREEPATVVVELLEVADPAAGHTSNTRDHAHAEAALQRALAADPSDPVGYVGEWHAHPAPQGPRRQDRRELRAVPRQSPHPVALVVLAYDPTTTSWTTSALTAASGHVRPAVVSEENAA